MPCRRNVSTSATCRALSCCASAKTISICGKSLALAATSAFIATRHGSPRLHCENPTRSFDSLRRPHAEPSAAAPRHAIASRRDTRSATALEPDGAEDDRTLENELQVRIDVVQPHAV